MFGKLGKLIFEQECLSVEGPPPAYYLQFDLGMTLTSDKSNQVQQISRQQNQPFPRDNFDLDPMTLVLKLDLDMVKVHTKMKFLCQLKCFNVFSMSWQEHFFKTQLFGYLSRIQSFCYVCRNIQCKIRMCYFLN